VLDLFRRAALEIDFPHYAAHDGAVYGPGMETVARLADPKRPFYYMVKRGSDEDCLDTYLLRQAQGLGVRVEFCANVALEEVDIVATGSRNANAYAVGYVFRTEAPDTSIVVFDDAFAPGAYTYLLINNGQGTVAIVTMKHDRTLKDRLGLAVKALQKVHPFQMRNAKRVGGSGTFRMPRTAVRDGRLYIGEAAGFQDSFAGFGMRYAVVSGHMAARSILEGLDYDALWRRQFTGYLRASIVNRWLQERFGNFANRALVWYFRLRRNHV